MRREASTPNLGVDNGYRRNFGDHGCGGVELVSDGISDGLSGFPGMPTTIVVAKAVQYKPDGTWYVFWETDVAYGTRGEKLTQAQAEDLARRLLNGDETI